MTLSLAATRYLISAGDTIGHKVAFFGKVDGTTTPDSAGYKVARIPGGLSDDGVKYPRKEVRIVGISDKLQWNSRIWIKPLGSNPTLWQYVGQDVEYYGRAEQAPHNALDPRTDNPFVHFRNVTDGKLFVAQDSNQALTLKLGAYNEWYINASGTVYSLGRGQSASDTIDLTSYVPAANLERLVLVYTNPTDNTDGVVSGSTRTISGAAWATSDIQSLVDSLPSLAIPREVWRLADNQTALRRSDFITDLRQIINVPRATNYSPIATKTADYTITTNDGTILIDTSSNDVTVTLPSASTATGLTYNIKAMDLTNTATLTTTSSQTIDGSTADIIYSAQYENITVQSDGSNWVIL